MNPGQSVFYALMIFVGGGVLALAAAIQTGQIPIPTEYAWLAVLVTPVLAGIGHWIAKLVPSGKEGTSS